MIKPSKESAPLIIPVLPGMDPIVEKEYTDTKHWVKYTLRRLAHVSVVPSANKMHGYEVINATRGERTLLPYNAAIWKQASIIAGKTAVTHADPGYEGIRQFHSSETITRRLDMLLATQGRPPIIRIRPGTKNTLFFVVYAALLYDPGNVTQWCDKWVDPSSLTEDSWLSIAWKLKLLAFTTLEEWGFRYSGRMVVNTKVILHSCMNMVKFKAYDAATGKNNYQGAIERCETMMRQKLKAIASEAELSYFATCGASAATRRKWTEQFENALRVAFA